VCDHDVEFSERRKRNVSGWHVVLRCNEWDATGVLERDLNETVVPTLQRNQDLWVRLSMGEEPSYSYDWQ
jgi:hypothetical protein